MRNVISKVIFFVLACSMGSGANSQNLLEKKIDSLFVIASSGEVKFQPLVQPAIDSIAALGAPAVPHLVDKLDTKSARERLTIINILKKIGSPAVPYLVTSLSLSNGLVVERIAWALGDIGDTSATIGLLQATNHSRWQVREQAIGSLGRLGDARGNEAVAAALDDTISLVRKAGTVSSGQLKLTGSIPKLVHLMGDSFYGVRLTAAAALLKLDTAQVITSVTDSLASDNRMVGNVGCGVLGQLATETVIAALVQQTKSPDADRRAHAAIALITADPQDKRVLRASYLKSEPDRLTRLKVESMISSVADGFTKQAQ